MDKKWIYKSIPSYKLIKELAEVLTVDDIIALLLLQRNLMTFEDAKSFFRPSLDQLHDPFLMKDMEKAVQRLEESFTNKEKVLIYGDYDVDGTTAVALMYGFLHTYHPYLDFYVPDRHTEGYGISKTAIDWAKSQGFSLIIALDCGISAVTLTDYAHSLGIDMVICDHHLPGEQIPNACAVLDPKRKDCNYPFKELSGCGIGFKLLQGFCLKNQIDPVRLYEFVDLVVVSIASDIVPIIGENRILAYYGLKKLNDTPRVGLKALMQSAGFSDEMMLNIRNLVFGIGPRINAAGRMHHANQAIELLISHDKQKAEEFARSINLVNDERKDIDSFSTQEAIVMVEALQASENPPKINILFKPDWHKGILGIVAARCIEKYNRPTIILTQNNGVATGSARSIAGFDMYEALHSCKDLLIDFGGHQQAAGLKIEIENIPLFNQKMQEIATTLLTKEQLIPLLEIDLKIDLEQITPKFFRILKQFAPFGPYNMRPVFVTTNLTVDYIKVLKEKHLSFRVKSDKTYFNAIAFGLVDYHTQLMEAKSIDLCYTIEENFFQGKTNLQLRAKDLKFNA
jgi:single-stranded-DNA-specific exonuclease